ncbi:MAG: hypothetical protein AAF705_08650 [Bacteroidota bacterium]
MANRLFNPFFFILLFCILPVDSALAQITEWQSDPSNITQYQVPKGWKVNTGQQQGVYTWKAKENPNDPLGGDITVLSMADFPNSSPALFIAQLENTIQGFQLLETKEISSDEYHYRASGNLESTKVLSNIIFLRDRNTQYLYLASFSVEEKRYSNLGGTSTLYKALQRVDPFSTDNASEPSTTPNKETNTGDLWNMQSYEVQNRVKAQAIMPEKQALVGEWMQAFSFQTGGAYQDVVSGQLSFNERGYGHLFSFNADGTYSLTYKYNSFNNGCTYQSDFFEKGRYSIEGRKLILSPSNFEGTYNICNKKTPENNTNPPKRTFDFYLDPSGKYAVIVGQPFEYSVSSKTYSNGKAYIEEGFNKTK